MNRFEFASQFTDEEKLAYFERKKAEAKDYATRWKYDNYAWHLRERMEREARIAKQKAEREKLRREFLDF